MVFTHNGFYPQWYLLTMDFLDVFTEITTFAILVENKKVVTIIDFNFFSNELINILSNGCSILYYTEGIVERGKKRVVEI
jgi:hypothetical protein